VTRLKTIFIDWNGTLSTSRFWQQLEEGDHPLHQYYPQIQSTLFKPDAPLAYLIDPWMRGKYTAEAIVETLSKKIDADPAKLFQELVISCQNMVLVSPQVPELVTKLKEKGLKVIAATDNMDTFVRFTSPSLKLEELFDGVLCSYDLKALKHDTDLNGSSLFFGKFLKENNLLPGESLLIDDYAAQKEAIESFGIKVDLIEPKFGLVKRLQEILETLN
jgi:FMN phosphatase YigB (HAD superfamily)